MKTLSRAIVSASLGFVGFASVADATPYSECVKKIFRAYFECENLGYTVEQCDEILEYGVGVCPRSS
jgi:hypothetical protein